MARPKLFQAILGSVLLLVGTLLMPFVVYAVAYEAFQPAFVAWLIGAPSAVTGYLLLKSYLARRAQAPRSYSDLDITFATLLKQNGWRISVAQFAGAAALSPEAAKSYLDEKALTLNGKFTSTEQGEELYVFELKKSV